MIVKDGKKHEVFNIDPDGIWTHSEDLSSGSRLHFQHVSDWDKPFKHLEFDKHKRAEVHDIISYEDEMGRSKKSKVTGVTDEGAIVETTKRGELIIIKHGDYEFTGKRYNVIKIKEEKPKERSRFIPQEVKDTVWRRAKGKCEICGSQVDLEFDHIIPFSKGGSNTYRNIQLLCVKCNREKSDSIG
ncbi:MAG: HNH endonuclease [Ignavibacteria bacterium]|nr:HNH endonuclease [Ignavibacteria bacterium]